MSIMTLLIPPARRRLGSRCEPSSNTSHPGDCVLIHGSPFTDRGERIKVKKEIIGDRVGSLNTHSFISGALYNTRIHA